jgi:hypothetical protein
MKHYPTIFFFAMNCCALFLQDVGQALETNGETSLMPKLSIVFPMMFFTFPTNTMIKNGMHFPRYRT